MKSSGKQGGRCVWGASRNNGIPTCGFFMPDSRSREGGETGEEALLFEEGSAYKILFKMKGRELLIPQPFWVNEETGKLKGRNRMFCFFAGIKGKWGRGVKMP